MAAKDWTKTSNYKNSSDIYSWVNKRRIRLVIYGIQGDYEVALSRLSRGYIKHLKSTKTKSEALNYAKSYMRKN